MRTDTDARRPGRQGIIAAAAEHLGDLTLKQLGGHFGSQSVATMAGVSKGTVSHHFRDSARLPYLIVQYALNRVAEGHLGVNNDPLLTAAMGLGNSGSDPIQQLADALRDDLLTYSPNDSEGANPDIAAEENALFLCATAAPKDPEAKAMARDFCRPIRDTYARIHTLLLAATGRDWSAGISASDFAVMVGALCDGFVWLRRFDPEKGTPELYIQAWMNLFQACTTPLGEDSGTWHEELTSAKVTTLDPDKRAQIVRAACEIYSEEGWERLNVTHVARKTGLSRGTITTHFGDSRGLAAIVWSRFIAELEYGAMIDSRKPVAVAVRSILARLSQISSTHRDLTAALLEGVFSYTVKYGRPQQQDPADPRNLVPLPRILAPVIRAGASAFRPGYAGSEDEAFDSAAFLMNQTLHLTMTRPPLDHEQVADRIADTTLAGMLRRRH